MESEEQEEFEVGEIYRDLHVGLVAARQIQDPAQRGQMRFREAVGFPAEESPSADLQQQQRKPRISDLMSIRLILPIMCHNDSDACLGVEDWGMLTRLKVRAQQPLSYDTDLVSYGYPY